jgi:hypothetical protein
MTLRLIGCFRCTRRDVNIPRCVAKMPVGRKRLINRIARVVDSSVALAIRLAGFGPQGSPAHRDGLYSRYEE